MARNLKFIDTGTLTCAGATGTANIGTLYGQIYKIQVTASAFTDFWIYCDASDIDNGNVVDEDILGVTGTKITVNTTLTAYPVVAQVVGSTNATTDPDQFALITIGGRVEVAYANAAADDTYRIVIWYYPTSGTA